MRTASQITGDFYKALHSGALAKELNGGIYYEGLRPIGSRREDAVLVFTQGQAGQVDTGSVTVLVYVPDIDHDGTGALVENKRRTSEVEAAALSWVKELQSDLTGYKIELSQTILTMPDDAIQQHFVSVKIYYESLDDENE